MESLSRLILILTLAAAGAIASAKQDVCEWNLNHANDNKPIGIRGMPGLRLVQPDEGSNYLPALSTVLITDEVRTNGNYPTFDTQKNTILQFYSSGKPGTKGNIERWIVVPKNTEHSTTRHTTRLELQFILEETDSVGNLGYKKSLMVETFKLDLHMSEYDAKQVVDEYFETLPHDTSRVIHLATCLRKNLAAQRIFLVVYDYDGKVIK